MPATDDFISSNNICETIFYWKEGDVVACSIDTCIVQRSLCVHIWICWRICLSLQVYTHVSHWISRIQLK